MTVSAKYTDIRAGIDHGHPVVTFVAEVTDAETGAVTVDTFNLSVDQFKSGRDGVEFTEESAHKMANDCLDARIALVEEQKASTADVSEVIAKNLASLVGVERTREKVSADVVSAEIVKGGKR